jgi:Na+/glutamate symporter
MRAPVDRWIGARARAWSRHIPPTLAACSPALLMAGCRRSPTFNIIGSFFPAWLMCMFAGILLAAASNRVFAYFKLDREISWSIVVYPCLALFYACALWLILFS